MEGSEESSDPGAGVRDATPIPPFPQIVRVGFAVVDRPGRHVLDAHDARDAEDMPAFADIKNGDRFALVHEFAFHEHLQ